jgi:hypothetical protein
LSRCNRPADYHTAPTYRVPIALRLARQVRVGASECQPPFRLHDVMSCTVGPEVETDDEVAYRSVIEVERIREPMRRGWLPGRDTEVTFGVHGAIAEH